MEAAHLSASTPEPGKGGIVGEVRRRTHRRIRERREKRDGDETRGAGRTEKKRREEDQMEVESKVEGQDTDERKGKTVKESFGETGGRKGRR